MTGRAAAALGLADRGTIVEGNAADLVLFNPETIADRASFDDPHRYPEGIEMVIVNGVVVIDERPHRRVAWPFAPSTRCDPRVSMG